MFRAEAFVHDTYGVRKDVRVHDASLLLDVRPRDDHLHKNGSGLDRGPTDTPKEIGQDGGADLVPSSQEGGRRDERGKDLEILKGNVKMERRNVNSFFKAYNVMKITLRDTPYPFCCHPAFDELNVKLWEAIGDMENAFSAYEDSKNKEKENETHVRDPPASS